MTKLEKDHNTDYDIDVALRARLKASVRSIPAAPSDEFERILARKPSHSFLSWTQLVPLSLGLAAMCWLLIINPSSNFSPGMADSEIDAFILESYSAAFQPIEEDDYAEKL